MTQLIELGRVKEALEVLKYDGQLFLMIFSWYGFGRMFIEGLRTDSLYFFNTSELIICFHIVKALFAALYHRAQAFG